MKIIKDYEVKNVKCENEITDYIELRDKNDIWLNVPINSCALLGYDLDEKKGIPEHFFNFNTSLTTLEDMLETAHDTGLYLIVPTNEAEKDYIIPVRYTAIESIFNRAGISGITIHNETEKPNAMILTKVQKAQIITRFFILYGAETKILVRDGKLSFMASSLYSILKEKELFDIVKEVISTEYPMNQFLSGSISHELFSLEYLFNDEDMELDMKNRLLEGKFPVNVIQSGFTFKTSDVGELSAAVYPYFLIDGKNKLCCGEPVTVKHIGKNNTKDFHKALNKMNKSFKSSVENFGKLAEMEITNAAHCLSNVCMYLKLPKKITLKVAEEFYKNHPLSCTGFDIYWAMCEIVNIYNKQEKTYNYRSLIYQEAVARAIDIDFRKFDNRFGIFGEVA